MVYIKWSILNWNTVNKLVIDLLLHTHIFNQNICQSNLMNFHFTDVLIICRELILFAYNDKCE